uniref:HMG box domain-containing protein n=1 Tax=Odontella aurita TaxID=265563 RepID=A0A7S4MAW3_9STRA|mmetsp:Transcript_16024/g.46091  ORF Transcript_16024/g.46091 Transcript_16024/m.46091 type:complete len:1615 (+) Transcript_16024:260-5104(+)
MPSLLRQPIDLASASAPANTAPAPKRTAAAPAVVVLDEPSGPDAAAGGVASGSGGGGGVVSKQPAPKSGAAAAVSKKKRSKKTNRTQGVNGGDGANAGNNAGEADVDGTAGKKTPKKGNRKPKKDPAVRMKTLNNFFFSAGGGGGSKAKAKPKAKPKAALTPKPKTKVRAAKHPEVISIEAAGPSSGGSGRVTPPPDDASADEKGATSAATKRATTKSTAAAETKKKSPKIGRGSGRSSKNSPSKDEIRAIVLGTLANGGGGKGPPSQGDDTPEAKMMMVVEDKTVRSDDPCVIPTAGITSQKGAYSPVEEKARMEREAAAARRMAEEEAAAAADAEPERREKEEKAKAEEDKKRNLSGAVVVDGDETEKTVEADEARPGSSGSSSSVLVSPSPPKRACESGVGGGSGDAEAEDSTKSSKKKRRAKLTLVSTLDGSPPPKKAAVRTTLTNAPETEMSGGADDEQAQTPETAEGSASERKDKNAMDVDSNKENEADHSPSAAAESMDFEDEQKTGGEGTNSADEGSPANVSVRLDFSPDDKKKKQNKSSPIGEGKGGVKGRGRGKNKKDPNAPKRASSAYIFFTQEQRSVVKKENPTLSFGELSKMVSAEFKALSAEARAKYDNLSARDKERYAREMKDYVPPSQDGNDDEIVVVKETPSKKLNVVAATPSKSPRSSGIEVFAVSGVKSTKPTKSKLLSPKPSASSSVTKLMTPPAPVPAAPLSEETKSTLAKHETLRMKYRSRAEELASRAGSVEEESFPERESLQSILAQGEEGQEAVFLDALVPELAAMVQGSPLPLSALAAEVLPKLRASSPSLQADSVSSKIKILAERKRYIAPHAWAAAKSGTASASVDPHEDADAASLWRWELTTLDLLPSDLVSDARKARAARVKLQRHHRAVLSVLSALDKADAQLLDDKCIVDKRKSALAKVGLEEERALKFEREEEKARLASEAKALKEKAKEKAKAEREAERKLAEEEKRKERDERKEEVKRKKEEAARLREEAKKKKEVEAEEKRRKEEEERERAVKKQKARMMSFFGGAKKIGVSSKQGQSGQNKTVVAGGLSGGKGEGAASFDGDKFWSQLGSHNTSDSDVIDPPLANLSSSARRSRSRKTRKVSVTVFVTVMPQNAFERQPYDEERTVTVPNKYKFLGFHEDQRPPYHGTWSKPPSKIVGGRTPFAKDSSFLDYDVDSEAEWEEDDDEPGEDCDADDDGDDEEEKMLDEEEGDTRMYNYQDGWLAQDDDLGLEDEDDDEETKALRRRKMQEEVNGTEGGSDAGNNGRAAKHSTVCVIAPLMGGIPQVGGACGASSDDNVAAAKDRCPELVQELVEGVGPREAADLLSSHVGRTLLPAFADFCFDAFPPEEPKKPKPEPKRDSATEKKLSDSSSTSQRGNVIVDMTPEEMMAFAKFVHNSTLGSRGKVMEGFRVEHPNVKVSRAEMLRKLDTISTKRRVNRGGFVWEVKEDMLKKCDLKASDLKPAPVEPPAPTKRKAEEKSPRSKSKKSKTSAEATDGKVQQRRKEGKQTSPAPSAAVSTGDDPLSGKKQSPKKATADDAKRGKKRTEVSKASANLFAAFLSKKKQKVMASAAPSAPATSSSSTSSSDRVNSAAGPAQG